MHLSYCHDSFVMIYENNVYHWQVKIILRSERLLEMQPSCYFSSLIQYHGLLLGQVCK